MVIIHHNITMVLTIFCYYRKSSFHFKPGLMLWLNASLWVSIEAAQVIIVCESVRCVCSAVHVACWELVWAVVHVCIDCQYIYLSDMLHSHCFRHVLSDRLIKLGLWHAQSRQLYQQPEKSLPFTTHLSINTKPLRAVSGSLTYRKKLRWVPSISLTPSPLVCLIYK